jgi:hypothetical protein
MTVVSCLILIDRYRCDTSYPYHTANRVAWRIPTSYFQETANVVRITSAGMRENHPHDVTITRKAPNHSVE